MIETLEQTVIVTRSSPQVPTKPWVAFKPKKKKLPSLKELNAKLRATRAARARAATINCRNLTGQDSL